MNLWITRNTQFGYRYTTDKQIRTDIINSAEWITNLVWKKGISDDYFVVAGGLFSSTNPSLIAIDDAHKFITDIAKVMSVLLINSSKDIRIFEKEYYSTLNIFKDLTNVRIIFEVAIVSGVIMIPVNDSYTGDNITLDVERSVFNVSKIPNLIQLEDEEYDVGILIYNQKKQLIIRNHMAPRHCTFIIKSIDDLKNINIKKHNDKIHLIIKEDLVNENQVEIDIIIHKINPTSVKYTDKYLDDIKENNPDVLIAESLNIVDTIYDHIGDNEELKNQFNRILDISSK